MSDLEKRKEILESWLINCDNTGLKQGHMECILEAMREYGRFISDTHLDILKECRDISKRNIAIIKEHRELIGGYQKLLEPIPHPEPSTENTVTWTREEIMEVIDGSHHIDHVREFFTNFTE